MSVMYWVAVVFAGLLVLGGLGLVVYMIMGGKKDDSPSLVVQDDAASSDAGKEEQGEPESVFSMPGVKTVAMPSEERPRSRKELRTATPAVPARRRSRTVEQGPSTSVPQVSSPAKNAAPFVAQNAAPRRASSFHELHPDDPDFIPKDVTERKPSSFRWEDEEN